MQFAAPSSGDILAPDTIIGHLLIIRPTEHATGINTTFGEKDGIRADVCVLTQLDDHGQPGKVYRNILWLQGKLTGSLKSQIGALVLARMSTGTPKPGQKPPFELNSALEDAAAVAAAEAWINAHPDFMATLKPPTAAPAPAPVAHPIPAPQVPAAAPAPLPVAQPVPVPAAVQLPLPVPAAAPVAVPAPVAAPTGGVIDAAVWNQLDPGQRAQLEAAGMRPAA